MTFEESVHCINSVEARINNTDIPYKRISENSIRLNNYIYIYSCDENGEERFNEKDKYSKFLLIVGIEGTYLDNEKEVMERLEELIKELF